MFKPKKNLTLFILIFLVTPFIVIPLKANLLDISKYPLTFFTFMRREIGAIIFFHHNFTQNERLKKQIDLLENKLNFQEEILIENERLKSLLLFKNESKLRFIAARVIGRAPEAWSSVVIIDKGTGSGLKPGMIAVSYLGLVGKIIETSSSVSKVILINDPDCGVSSIAQRSRQEGLVTGTLGNNLIMKYLPEECDIEIGDIVLTSGLDQIYPKGLVIGEIVSINKDFSGLSRYAVIKPAVNLSRIEEVLIVIP